MRLLDHFPQRRQIRRLFKHGSNGNDKTRHRHTANAALAAFQYQFILAIFQHILLNRLLVGVNHPVFRHAVHCVVIEFDLTVALNGFFAF